MVGLAADRQEGSALVIGGTGALGAAICRALSANWSRIVFTGHSRTADADALAGALSCRATWMKADLHREEDLAAAVALADAEKDLCGVIFAAGAQIEQPFISTIEQAQWDDVIDVELMGLIRTFRLALPALRRRGGVLVTVGSFATHRFPPGDAISAVPKAGMEMFTRAIAREEGRYGIRANTVAPGIIDDGIGRAVQETVFTKEIWDQQRLRVPLRRFGTANDVANAVDFLASPRSSYISGQTVLVDGGLHI
jgi:NAD(P)-dependent dehydrogenase (short-subunit alcohol dehydrogenase family)